MLPIFRGDMLNKLDMNLLNELTATRNLSSKTKQSYEDALKCYVDFNNKFLVDLLGEAEQEEDNGVRWKNRKLKYRLINFRVYLQEKYLISTAKVYFQRVLTFYRHYEVEIHKLPPISTKSCNMSKPITFEDLPTKEIIRKAIKIANPIMKAIILFILSSGCARNETLNLTIQDFIDSTFEYHNKKDIKEALLLLTRYEEIIPCFRIRRRKTNKFYFTFCSPEASKEIINYLISTERYDGSEKLFNINLYYFNKYFMFINNELNLGKVGTYNRFRSHMLRKFHASSLYNCKNGLTLNEIDSLQGRGKTTVHSVYFMENPNVLKEKYIKSLDALRISSY